MSEQRREDRQAARLSVSDSGAVAARDVYLSGTYVAGRDIVLQQPRPAPQALFQLPAEVPDFTDRERELSELLAAFERPAGDAPVVRVVAGKPGVGKSALAMRLAHQLKPRFPDAQLYADLRGGEPAEGLEPVAPGEVLADFVRALGVEEVPVDDEQRLALYRDKLADMRALVVLDNASHEAQVRPLIPGSGNCAVLVTSRVQLVALEGAPAGRPLEVLEPGAALELFSKLLGDPQRLAREQEAGEQIVRLCGRLPLAVRIAGARLSARPRWRLQRLAERLADERRRLDELEAGDREVRASFALSYRELEPDEARLFRLLGPLRGPDFGAPLAAALLDTDLHTADELLERLVDAQLLEPVGEERYGFHDLLRVFARERLEADEDAEARRLAAARALRWYLDTAEAADALLQAAEGAAPPEPRSEALTWFESERANLVAAVELAHQLGDWDATWRLAAQLTGFFDLRAHLEDWRHTHELALDAARRAGDRGGEAQALNNLGLVYARQGRLEDALASYERSLAMKRELGDRRGEAQALGNRGNVYANQGRLDDAIASYERSLEICRELGDRRGVGQALGNLGIAYDHQGRLEDAIASYERSLEICRELGDRRGEAQTLGNLGIVYANQGRLDDAIASYERSLEICRELGDRHGEAQALGNLGNLYVNQGRLEDALATFEQDLATYRELGDRRGEAQTLNNLGNVYVNQGRWQDALASYEQSLAMKGELGDRRGEAQTLGNLGVVYDQHGRLEDALTSYEESLATLRELGDRRGEAQALGNLGIAYANQGRLDDAIASYERSLEICRELGDRRGEAQALGNLGALLEAKGEKERGRALGRDALAILDALGAPEAEQVRAWLAIRR